MKLEDLKVGEEYLDATTKPVTIVFVSDYLFVAQRCDNGSQYSDVSPSFFRHIPKEPKIEILYECLSNTGCAVFCFDDGRFPSFSGKKKLDGQNTTLLKRKTGRTLKLNMETWEIVL